MHQPLVNGQNIVIVNTDEIGFTSPPSYTVCNLQQMLLILLKTWLVFPVLQGVELYWNRQQTPGETIESALR